MNDRMREVLERAIQESAESERGAPLNPYHLGIVMKASLKHSGFRYETLWRALELATADAVVKSALAEIGEIASDALDSEDFQACFSVRNHMTGPALRGCLERICDAVKRTGLATADEAGLTAIRSAVERGLASGTLRSDCHVPVDDGEDGYDWCVDCGEAWPCCIEEMRRALPREDGPEETR